MSDPVELVKNRKELYEEMQDNYGYVFCEFCMTSNAFKFSTHHIVFRSEKPGHEKLHSKVNLLICCNICHSKFHSKKDIRNNIMIERGLDKIFNINI